MRSLVILAIVTMAAVLVSPKVEGQEPVPTPTPTAAPGVVSTPTPTATPRPVVTSARYRRAMRKVYRFRNRGGDYWASPAHQKGRRWLSKLRGKAVGPKSRRHMLRMTHHRRERWRFHRHIDEITAYGKYAIPSYIVYRESRGDQHATNDSSSAGGWYQFLDSTWVAYGGRLNGCSHPAACAPDWEQHEVASRAWAGGAGSSHWALTR